MLNELTLESTFLGPRVYKCFSGPAGNGVNFILIPKDFLKIAFVIGKVY